MTLQRGLYEHFLGPSNSPGPYKLLEEKKEQEKKCEDKSPESLKMMAQLSQVSHLSNNRWFVGSLKNGKPDGEGTLVAPKFYFKGRFKEGKEDGAGVFIFRDSDSKLSANFQKGCIDGELTFMTSKGNVYQGRSISVMNHCILWKEKKFAFLAQWINHDKELSFYKEVFIKVLDPEKRSSSIEPYTFKEGTRCLNVSSTLGRFTEYVEKMGFIFTQIDHERLHHSSAEVQEHVMVELLSRNFWVSQQKIVQEALESMPVADCHDDLRYFICLEERTGNIAAAIFAEVDPKNKSELNKVFLHSVVVEEKFRRKRLGSAMLAMTIRSLMRTDGIKNITLHGSSFAMDWYDSFGFSVVYYDALELDLDKKSEKKTFEIKEKEVLDYFKKQDKKETNNGSNSH
ncbi:MAG: GNAT family N-acetyltransferase [Chlamydiota bacterium]